MHLVVKDTIGQRCIIKEDGQKLAEVIRDALHHGETVTLDFAGVEQCAAPFFNGLVGLLLHAMAAPDLRRLLQLDHLTPTGHDVVERVFATAVPYHGDKAYRTRVDQVLKQHLTESA